MGIRQDLTIAFINNSTEQVLAAFQDAINKSKEKDELEFFSGISIITWKNKLKKEITIGEFLVLIHFFKIDISLEDKWIPTEVPLLERSFRSVNDLLTFKVIFNTNYWIHQDLEFDESFLDPFVKSTHVLNKYNNLLETIVGQNDALQRLLYTIHTNINIIQHNEVAALPIPKRNILIQGGTGTGKTFMVERVAQQLKIPFTSFDTSQLTQAGYVGYSVEDITELLQDNGDMIQILFLDEVDKLCMVDNRKDDVNTYGGQKALLKILEANITKIPVNSKNKTIKSDYFDLKNVIIILGGSFSAFEDIRALEKRNSIGFSAGDKGKSHIENEISEQDLVKAGIIPEIAGRIGQVIRLNMLSDESLRQILLHSKESILKQFKILAKYDGETFDLTEKDIKQIINDSKELKMGVRGLATLTEKKFLDKMLKLKYT